MQIEFLRDRERAQIGQKADSLPAMLVSATSIQPQPIAFGRLVVFDETDAFLCKSPTTAAHLEKPLGITVRQLHSDNYQPRSSIVAMRKGRIWVEADNVDAPGDAVYIKLNDNGAHAFTGSKTETTPLRGAIFLEKSEGGKVPIEVNFFGGVA